MERHGLFTGAPLACPLVYPVPATGGQGGITAGRQSDSEAFESQSKRTIQTVRLGKRTARRPRERTARRLGLRSGLGGLAPVSAGTDAVSVIEVAFHVATRPRHRDALLLVPRSAAHHDVPHVDDGRQRSRTHASRPIFIRASLLLSCGPRRLSGCARPAARGRR